MDFLRPHVHSLTDVRSVAYVPGTYMTIILKIIIVLFVVCALVYVHTYAHMYVCTLSFKEMMEKLEM